MPNQLKFTLDSLYCKTDCWGFGADTVVVYCVLYDASFAANRREITRQVSNVYTIKSGQSTTAAQKWTWQVPVPIPFPDKVELDVYLVKIENNLPQPSPLPPPPPAPVVANPSFNPLSLVTDLVSKLVETIAEWLLTGTLGFNVTTYIPNVPKGGVHHETLKASGHGSDYTVKYTMIVG